MKSNVRYLIDQIHWKHWRNFLPFLLFVILAIKHASVIYKFAVDIPFWDEWTGIIGDGNPENGLSKVINWNWVFYPNNQHIIAVPKIYTWILYHLNGWNLICQQVINFLIFLLIPFLWWRILIDCKSIIGTSLVLPYYGLFLLTPLCVENHHWGFQSSFHFCLIFFLASTLLLFRIRRRFWMIGLASLFSVLGAFSLSIGISLALVSLGMFGVVCLRSAIFGVNLSFNRVNRAVLEFVIYAIPIVSAIVIYYSILKIGKPSTHLGSLTYPNQLVFWSYWLKLVASSFGFQQPKEWIGVTAIILLTIILILALVRFRKPELHEIDKIWTVGSKLLCILLGIFTSLGAISLGRAHIYDQTASRYMEIQIMLIPLVALLGEVAFSKIELCRKSFHFLFLLLLLIKFVPNWNYKAYQSNFDSRNNSIECIQKALQNQTTVYCPGVCWAPIDKYLVTSKKLNISFTRKLKYL